MTFEIEINGRTRSVSIERAGRRDRFRVTVDGVATLVDAQQSGESGLSLLFPDGGHGAARVSLASGSAPGELFAYVRGRSVSVIVNGRRSGRAAAETGAGPHGEQKVLAPMPGRV